MLRQLFTFVLVVASVLAPFGVFAQNNLGCRLRSVTVTVADAKGKPVTGLTANSFQGQFRGQPVRIHHARMTSGSPRFVVALDISGSMERSLRPSGIAWTIAGNAIESAPPGSAVGLILFNEKIGLRIGLTQDRAALLEELKAAMTTKGIIKGRTAIRDAVMEAVAMLGRPRPGDVIYLITDGGDNMSWTKESEFTMAVATSGARIFGVLFADLFPTTPEEREGPGLMSGLSKMSGGITVVWSSNLTPGGRRTLDSLLRRLYFDMQNYYELMVELPAEIDKPHDWKLHVVDDHGRKLSRYEVFYPRTLAPCPSTVQTNGVTR
ncbi:MAG TPA: VWA domain-containing protein [Terriglobales bacterium]|nr:VWA domain-containing protein [Terriglobales bacterium]